ncbi:MAG: hypothetical protein WKF96_00720 [Solirubrobacteraceae bacterium]
MSALRDRLRRPPAAAGPSDHRGERLPLAQDWSDIGGHHQILPSEGGTGFETPGRLSRTASNDGQDFGAARLPAETALGPDAAPNRFIRGSVGVRKGVITQNAARARVPAQQRARTVEARRAEAKERVAALRQRLMRLMDRLSPLEQRVQERERTYRQRRDDYLALHRSMRGYFASHRPALAVGIGVVVFDVGVLHGVMEYSGAGRLTVWLTSLSVPIAIGAVNHGFGVLAGAIGARTAARHRLKLALALFIAGLGALLIAVILLTLFRSQAAGSQNAALQALAEGDAQAQLTFFVSPIWMGPLQVAGSLAAIAMTACWVMAKEGRDVVELVLAPAQTEWREAASELAHLRQRIEETHDELEMAARAVHHVDADAQAAQVEVEASAELLQAALDAEDELAQAMQARYETTEQYFEQIGRSGGVWRTALATVFPRAGRPYTPGAIDAHASDDFVAARHAEQQPQRHRAGGGARGRLSDNGHRDHAIAFGDVTTNSNGGGRP